MRADAARNLRVGGGRGQRRLVARDAGKRRKPQELGADAALHAERGEFMHPLRQAADLLGEAAQHGERDAGIAAQHLLEAVGGERGERAILHRLDPRRSRSAVDGGDLAEFLARQDVLEQHGVALGRIDHRPRLAGDQEVDLIRGVLVGQDRRAGRIGPPCAQRLDICDRRFVKTIEKREAPQRVSALFEPQVSPNRLARVT